jgi:tetratricopeptide (TPR) repeat protein
LTFITSQPGAWLKLLGRKLVLLLNAAEMVDTESQESYAEWSWPVRLGGWIGHFGVLVPLALFGAWMVWPERQRLSLFYAMTAVYAATVLLFYVFARYRFPLVPLLVLFASAGIFRAPGFIRAGSRGQKIAACVILLATVVATNWPLVPSGFPQAVTENNLGIALQAQGRLDAAAEHFQRAIAFRNDFTPAYNNIGLVLRAQGRADEAMKTFGRAIAARPGYPDSYYNLGVELQARGEHARAIEQFREFNRRTQDEANVISAGNRIGRSLFALGRLDEAAAAYRVSLAREPGNVDALSGLADVLFRQGRFEDAARQYREYVRRTPANADAFHNLGLALVRQNKLSEAVDAFAQAVSLQPANAAFHEDLGNALASLGRLDEAEARYRRALELAPRNVKIRNSLALALAAQGNMQEALAEFQRSLEIEPDNVQTRIDLETARRMRR